MLVIRISPLRFFPVFLCLVLNFSLLYAAEVTSQRLLEAEKEPHNWLTYGGTYKAWRYSPLDQIKRSNIKKLVPVWTFQTGVVDGGFQTTPLVEDGIMYITSSWNRIFAIDAVTGKELWHYYYAYPKDFRPPDGPWNRGAALAYGLVFMGTNDNSLVAVDQKTGKEVWKVNIESREQCGCAITGAPLVVKDKVVVGVTGGDAAHRGYINAFDVKTGRRAWRFWTIPGPGEKGHETWSGDSWKMGGGSSWMTGSYDSELNLIYWGVGNPAADFYGDPRGGDNLYTDSVVALDADTGQLKWYYQEIPHDVWDWDSAYEAVLLDLPVNGTVRKILVNPNKGGYTWVIDRTNGEFLNAWPLAENINWIKGIGPKGELIGRNEPVLGKPIFICPCIGGGRSWNHAAYSPRTGFFYSTGTEWCQNLTAQREEPKQGMPFFGGNFELRKPPTGEPEGNFFALDAKTGEKVWSYKTGSGHRGSPISYSVKGKQYIAVPTGWGSAVASIMTQLWPEAEDFPGGCTLFVFALTE